MTTGRYLSPEPLLQDPNWVKAELVVGHHVPSYGYAGSNPVTSGDPTGLFKKQIRVLAESVIEPLLPLVPTIVSSALNQAIFPWEPSPLGDGTPQYSFETPQSRDTPVPVCAPQQPFTPGQRFETCEILFSKCYGNWRQSMGTCNDCRLICNRSGGAWPFWKCPATWN